MSQTQLEPGQIGTRKESTYNTINVVIGDSAGAALTPGFYSTGGYSSGNANTLVGASAGLKLVSGNENTLIGFDAGANLLGTGVSDPNSVAALNTFIGSSAGGNATTARANTFIGQKAGSTITTGGSNVMIGKSAGANATVTGSNQVIIGDNAGVNANGGDGNVLIGAQSGAYTNGNTNVAIGYYAGGDSTARFNNSVFIGYNAGNKSTSDYNVYIGYQAGQNLVGGSGNNIFIGPQAGNGQTAGDSNIVIGQFTDLPSLTGSGLMNIANLLYGKNIYGSSGKIGIYVPSPTARLHVAASTTAIASMNINQGAAPTSPNDGDMWIESNTNTGFKIRINGVTKTITLS